MCKTTLITAAVIVFSAATGQADVNWEQSLSTGLNITRGNSETIVTHAEAEASYNGKRHEHRYVIDGSYGESKVDGETEKTVGYARGLAEYKFMINRSYLYANNSILHDSVADLDYRLIMGGGGGYRVIRTERIRTGLELGAAYVREAFSDGSKENDAAFRLAARHDQRFSDNAARWWANIEYLPQADDFAIYLLNSETGIEAAINQALSLRVVIRHRYDSDVLPDSKKGDLSLISSLVYTR